MLTKEEIDINLNDCSKENIELITNTLLGIIEKEFFYSLLSLDVKSLDYEKKLRTIIKKYQEMSVRAALICMGIKEKE